MVMSVKTTLDHQIMLQAPGSHNGVRFTQCRFSHLSDLLSALSNKWREKRYGRGIIYFLLNLLTKRQQTNLTVKASLSTTYKVSLA